MVWGLVQGALPRAGFPSGPRRGEGEEKGPLAGARLRGSAPVVLLSMDCLAVFPSASCRGHTDLGTVPPLV